MADVEQVREALQAQRLEPPSPNWRTIFEAARLWVADRDDRKTWPYCPICGRLNRPADGGEVDVTYCSPTNCDAWKVTATFDHATREWNAADPGESP